MKKKNPQLIGNRHVRFSYTTATCFERWFKSKGFERRTKLVCTVAFFLGGIHQLVPLGKIAGDKP